MEKDKKTVLDHAKHTPYEWAIVYLCRRYGVGKISARNTEEVVGVTAGILYGSKLTNIGGLTVGILLEANGCFRTSIDSVPMLAAAYSLNAIFNKESALKDICDQADAYAKVKGLTIPVGKKK